MASAGTRYPSSEGKLRLDDYQGICGESVNDRFYLVISKDGRIVIGVDFTTYNGISRGHIARI